MTFIKKLALCGVMTLAALSGHAFAQERTAGSTVEVQMTWSSLSDQIRAANNRITTVETITTQIKTCGKKGKVYAPGVTGSDADGCGESASNSGVSMTTIVTTLNNLSTATATNTTKTNTIVNCGASGYTFNGTGCVAPKTPTCSLVATGPSGATHTSSNFSNGTCASGTVSVGTGSSSGALKCLRVVCS